MAKNARSCSTTTYYAVLKYRAVILFPIVGQKAGRTTKEAQMAFVTLAALLSLASITTVAVAQSELPWTWPYLRVYPPVSADEDTGGTTSLYFALMMSFGGNLKSSGTIPGVEAALDGINGDPTLLPGYKLHYTLTDSQVSG